MRGVFVLVWIVGCFSCVRAVSFCETGPLGSDRAPPVLSVLVSDFRVTFQPEHLVFIGGALGIAAPIANSPLDAKIDRWYQRNVRSPFTDTVGSSYLLTRLRWRLAIVGTGMLFEAMRWTSFGRDNLIACWIGTYTERLLRAVLQTIPPVWLLQPLLGSTRPEYGLSKGSYWRPFHSQHGVSGDAYVGSLLFLTAANMSSAWYLQAPLYVLSLFPALGRVNIRAHYFSQAALGWFFGFLGSWSIAQSSRHLSSRYTREKFWHAGFSPFLLPKGGYGVVAFVAF